MRFRENQNTSRHGVGGSCEYLTGVLRVGGHLHRNQLGAFRECIEAMVADNQMDVRIDFLRCRYLSSMFIGHLVDGILRAQEKGKRVVVEVSPEIGHFFEMAHLDQLFAYSVSARTGVGSGHYPAVAQGA